MDNLIGYLVGFLFILIARLAYRQLGLSRNVDRSKKMLPGCMFRFLGCRLKKRLHIIR